MKKAFTALLQYGWMWGWPKHIHKDDWNLFKEFYREELNNGKDFTPDENNKAKASVR